MVLLSFGWILFDKGKQKVFQSNNRVTKKGKTRENKK